LHKVIATINSKILAHVFYRVKQKPVSGKVKSAYPSDRSVRQPDK